MKVSPGHFQWTREENLCIYYYLDRFPEKAIKKLQSLLRNMNNLARLTVVAREPSPNMLLS